jgi:hypothetical protein
MKRLLLALLANLLLFSSSYAQVENPFNFQIPDASMVRLLELVSGIASNCQLEVKSIQVERSVCHPNDRPGILVQFQERCLGGDVYEFSFLTITNGNWLRYSDLKKAGFDWGKAPPASVGWEAWSAVRKVMMLRLSLDGKETFVSIEDEENVAEYRLYLEKFIEWTRSNPEEFKNQLSELSRIGYVVQERDGKKLIGFYFNKKLKGVGYMFDITDRGFIYKGISKWMS